MAASRSSFPSPSEPNLRRLGQGGGGGDRPIRAQLVVLCVLALVVVAVPLYFLRGPQGEETATTEAEANQASRNVIQVSADSGVPTLDVRLGRPKREQCSASPTRSGNQGSLCDRLPGVEAAFAEAIKRTAECAPRTGKEGTINYVLTLHFPKRRLNVFPGASGQWKGPQAKAAAQCVKKEIRAPDWDNLPHRYRYYMISVLATYPAPDPLESLPVFE